jgi:hypothetical protein
MTMKDQQQEPDRHLQAPSEANRDKHINFLAEERGEQDPADEGIDRAQLSENTKPENVYAHDEERDRHLQAPTEANRDEHINFTALERGEKDPSDEETAVNASQENSPQVKDNRTGNPVYTNGSAPQQQIERDTDAMSTGTKVDSSSIYNTDDSTLQTKKENEQDNHLTAGQKDKLEVPDVSDTEADQRFKRRGENSNKNL